ncbi:hypothetical protein [Microcoleus sp. OTE_8_concoct_300]|uniref:hypothetical protein n=1 Tax=Microcoleus sp. OTE_8_concoct_300 TaxID=2964710 RepID=UPI00403F5C59
MINLKIAWAIALLSIGSADRSIGIKNPTTQTPQRIEPLQQLTALVSLDKFRFRIWDGSRRT